MSVDHELAPGDSDEVQTIFLTGPVTLYEVGAIRETLCSALAEGKRLRIDLSDSGPWDLAGLQLLISCVKTGRDAGQSVHLANVPAGCTDVAERSGLSSWLRNNQGQGV
jgi:ABC-type transporter Mla MlaB component